MMSATLARHLRIAASVCRCHKSLHKQASSSRLRNLHSTAVSYHRDGTPAEIAEEKKRKVKEMILFKELSEAMQKKDKETFLTAISIFEKKQSVYKRGHVDFIRGALEQMKDFDVHKDNAVYNALMEVFPEGVMVHKNVLQAEFMHYPKQQDCAMGILIYMERNGVIPDDRMGELIDSRFGPWSYVMKRYQRMMYWMPKFRTMNPHPIPFILPRSGEELALIALRRMARDKNNEVRVQYSHEIEASNEDTFIATAISQCQRDLMAAHDASKPLLVEGGFTVWLRLQSLTYFVLRAEPTQEILEYNKARDDNYEQEVENVSAPFYSFIGADDEEKAKTALIPQPSIHEQEDGTILAMCITGTSSKDSLVSWISLLQEENPCLSKIPIVFSLRSPDTGLQTNNPPDTKEDPQLKQGSPSQEQI